MDAQLVHCLAARTLADEILDVLSVMEASLRRFFADDKASTVLAR